MISLKGVDIYLYLDIKDNYYIYDIFVNLYIDIYRYQNNAAISIKYPCISMHRYLFKSKNGYVLLVNGYVLLVNGYVNI